ncbi:hypothetical protein Golomagni_00312 [Golovinomyces magnicellulatus]|nr:hypothetical protein Golomagni_00312 [Golovinomyces magnicellulatus]
MSTLLRTLINLWKIGLRDAAHQMHVSSKTLNDVTLCLIKYAGDTKAGTMIGVDRYGNKYYENLQELPLRTRWVDYKDYELDP